MAQFILKNADVQHTATAAYDPYTGQTWSLCAVSAQCVAGGSRYIPGQSSGGEYSLGGGAPNDPFMGN